MGHKKSKQQRQAAAFLAPMLHKYSPKIDPKTTENTCALTGERLRDGTARRTMPNDDRIAFPRNPDADDLRVNSLYVTGYRVSLPTRLHTRETEGPLGGHAYAAPFLKFMDAGNGKQSKGRHEADGLSRQEYAERFWWSPEWAERELRAHFAADVVDIVLSVRRDHADWDSAMLGSDRALGDVQAQERLMGRHCRMLIRQETAQAAA